MGKEMLLSQDTEDQGVQCLNNLIHNPDIEQAIRAGDIYVLFQHVTFCIQTKKTTNFV